MGREREREVTEGISGQFISEVGLNEGLCAP